MSTATNGTPALHDGVVANRHGVDDQSTDAGNGEPTGASSSQQPLNRRPTIEMIGMSALRGMSYDDRPP
ncbi:MAG: hypothetical protein U0Q12_19860 [Vicinamibacterales bacterium]